jgi:hypothetical protein
MKRLAVGLLALALTGCVGKVAFQQATGNILVADLKATSANFGAAITAFPAAAPKLAPYKSCVDGVLALAQPGDTQLNLTVNGIFSGASVAIINVTVANPQGTLGAIEESCYAFLGKMQVDQVKLLKQAVGIGGASFGIPALP